jgi:adenylate kinase
MQGHTYLLMGRPGCGKDTQGKLLAEKLGARLFSSGEKFRELVRSGSAAGKRLKEDLENGMLMPVWYACFLFEGAILDLTADDFIVFQGACRILPEAELFDELHTWLKRPYTVIYIDITEDTMRQRVAHRGEGRAEDGAHAIQNRITEFNTKTVPSIEFFKSKGTLISVSGEQSIEKVHQDVLAALGI